MDDFRRSFAAVIGINKYGERLPELHTAAPDARAIAELLQNEHGYEVTLLVDEQAKLDGILRLLDELRAKVDTGDRVLFYFAGHGVAQDAGDEPEGALLPQGANPDDPTTFLPMATVSKALQDLSCRHLLAILDCCFAGRFNWAPTRSLVLTEPPAMYKERYKRFVHDPAWQVITSAAHDQRALDIAVGGRRLGARKDGGDHSPFAGALLRGLDRRGEADLSPRPAGDGAITATELYLYLRDQVESPALGGLRQTPGLWPLRKHDKGEYIFRVPGRAFDPPPAPILNPDNNPYRGIEPFAERHRELFFGRENVLKELVARVADRPLTLVLGPSGSGKTSLLQAGLLASLRGEQRGEWRIAPSFRPGLSPIEALAEAAGALEPSIDAGELRRDAKALAVRLGAAAAREPTKKLLLVIDPLDDLFAQGAAAGDRAQFFLLLAEAAAALPGQLRIVGALGRRFEADTAETALGPLLPAARLLLPRMEQDELRQAIEGPATVRVLYFEPSRLVDVLINDVLLMSGSLPILSLALSRLYALYLTRGVKDRALALEDYRQGLGSAAGLLAGQAEGVFASLDARGQETLRRVLLRTIHASTRLKIGSIELRRVPLSELSYEDELENGRVREILEKLVGARVLVEDVIAGGGAEPEPGIEVCDRSLVKGWARLLAWVSAAEGELRWERRLTADALDWDAGGRDPGVLWDGDERLPDAEKALGEGESRFNRLEAAFVRESLEERRRTASRRLAKRAEQVLEPHTNLALLLSVEACELAETFEARSALLKGLLQVGHRATTLMETIEYGYDAEMSSMAFTSDGATLISVSSNGPVSFWDVAERAQIGEPLVTEQSRCVAIDPTGTYLALGQENGDVVLWDLVARRKLEEPLVAEEYGKRLEEPLKSAVLARRREEGAVVEGALEPVNGIVFSPHGTLLASVGDTSIAVWNVRERRRLDPFVPRREEEFPQLAAFSPDGKTLAIRTSKENLLWDLAGRSVLGRPFDHPELQFPTSSVFHFAFSPDGKILAFGGGGDGAVGLWDTTTQKVNRVAWSRDQRNRRT